MVDEVVTNVMSGYYTDHDQGEELLRLDLKELTNIEIDKLIQTIIDLKD